MSNVQSSPSICTFTQPSSGECQHQGWKLPTGTTFSSTSTIEVLKPKDPSPDGSKHERWALPPASSFLPSHQSEHKTIQTSSVQLYRDLVGPALGPFFRDNNLSFTPTRGKAPPVRGRKYQHGLEINCDHKKLWLRSFLASDKQAAEDGIIW